jgi:hypothetical protein
MLPVTLEFEWRLRKSNKHCLNDLSNPALAVATSSRRAHPLPNDPQPPRSFLRDWTLVISNYYIGKPILPPELRK